MSGFADQLAALAYEQARRNHDVIEAACESMFTTPGDRGVLVTDLPGGAVSAELSDEVPFGEIHYRRTP